MKDTQNSFVLCGKTTESLILKKVSKCLEEKPLFLTAYKILNQTFFFYLKLSNPEGSLALREASALEGSENAVVT